MSNSLLDDPNINKNDLTLSQIEKTYKLTGNPKEKTLIFRKDMVSLCKGSAWAVLLYDQLYYYLEWKANKTKKPITEVEIYKFLAPCNHPLYKEGDSFCEELGITEYKYRTAIKKIGFKINWKTTEQEIKQSKSLILYRKDAKNVTWYKLNPFLIDDTDPINKTKKLSKQRTASSPKRRSSGSPNEGHQVRYNIENYIDNLNKENNYKQELVAKQLFSGKGSQGSDSAIKVVPAGTNEPAVRKPLDKNIDGSKVKKINGKNNKSCKKVKIKLRTRKHKNLANGKDEIDEHKETQNLANGKDEIDEHKETQNLAPVKPLPRLPKIKIEPNPLSRFNFPQEVFEILNHWKNLGGKIPKDPNRRKIADTISNQIQELLIPGNNPYTPVLTDNELDQLRTKKWTVQEIKDSITHYKKALCKPIEQITFLQFILFRNYQKKDQKDFSPLILAYQALPQQLSYLAKKLKDDFTSDFSDVPFYDKTFINVATFLEAKLDQYKSYQPYSGIYFEDRFVNEIFFIYMTNKVKPKGTYEELKYMANPQNLREFILWCVDLNLIKSRTDEEMKKHQKITKQKYKNQIKSYQKEIKSGKADSKWTQEKWDYFNFMKEKIEC